MKVQEIECKSALSTSKLPGIEYSLNPYRGCQHQCAYCYVPTVLHIPRNEWGAFVQAKRNIPRVLAKELQTKKPGIVCLSTVTDPYQPIEKTFRLTRYCLQQLLSKGWPICIQTKSSLILQDMDLINQFSQAEVMMSIGTCNDAHRKILEPASSPISERLQVLKAFAQTKVKTSVFFGPIYPMITVDALPGILDKFIDAEVDEVMIDTFHMKTGLQQYLTTILKEWPDIKHFFSTENLTDQAWASHIHNTIYEYLKNAHITVVKAF